MQRRPLDDLQAELDASNAARLERIQHGANTRSLPWAERSFSNRKTDAPDAEVPAPVPQPAPAAPEEMAKRVEALGRDVAIASARLDLIESEDDRNGDLTISDPPWEHFVNFAVTRLSDTKVRIGKGQVIHPGYSEGTVGPIDLTFSGASTEYVYVSKNLQTQTNTIAALTSRQTDSETGKYKLLYTYVKDAGGTYVLSEVNHVGAWHVDIMTYGFTGTGDILVFAGSTHSWHPLARPGSGNWVLTATVSGIQWANTILHAGSTTGDIQYWNGSAWVALAAPAGDSLLRNNAGTLSWVDRADYLNP